MKEKKANAAKSSVDERLQILEERYLYQERTIDALNEVIIEQQNQFQSLSDQIRRLQGLLTALQDSPVEGEEPPPPHY